MSYREEQEKERKAHETAQVLKMVVWIGLPIGIYQILPNAVFDVLGYEGVIGLLLVGQIGLIILFGEALHGPFIRLAYWWHGMRDRT